MDHDVAYFYVLLIYYTISDSGNVISRVSVTRLLSGPSLVGYSGYIGGQSWSRLYNFRFCAFPVWQWLQDDDDETASLRRWRRQLHEFACLTQIRQRKKETERERESDRGQAKRRKKEQGAESYKNYEF